MQKASMGLMARKRICGEASIYATLSVCVCVMPRCLCVCVYVLFASTN